MKAPARQTTSIALLVAGCLCILAGAFTLYARTQVLSAEKLADKAERTLDDPDVRGAASKQITEDLIGVDPDLVTAKPLIEVGTAALIDSAPFKAAFRQGIEQAYDAVVNGNDGAVVTVANVGVLIDQAVRQFKPALAKKIPNGLDATLVRIGEGGLAVDGAQAIDDLRLAGLVLPPLGILLLAGSILAAAERRRAVIRAGAGLAAIALLAIVVLVVVRELVEARISDEVNRDAFGPVWETFLGPLRSWYLLIGGFGVIVASAASSALGSRDLGEPLRWAWERAAREPETRRGKLLWATGVAIAGLAMVLRPRELLEILVVIGGAYLVSLAVATVVGLAEQPISARASKKRQRRRILAWTAGGIVAAVIAAGVLGAILIGGDENGSEVAEGKGCNGIEELCDRRLDEVAFAATHNSYAGANYPGFLFPEQDNTIPQQMDAGIRGLWIDTYYGVPGRRVYTETSKVDPALIAQVTAELGPKFAAAAASVRSKIAKPPAGAKTEIYLCHGFCELGAVSAEQTFREIAEFLEDHPNEVMIIDLEDYTTPEDTQALIEKTGLVDYIYKGEQGPPWPTLREMIESGGRVLLVSEHMSGGESWYRPLDSTIQETLFEYKPADMASPKLMTCKGGRGDRSDTIFLINHWIGTDPTPKPSNARIVNARPFLLERARRCERQRSRFPNVLNVDFYKQGDVFGVVKELNGTDPSATHP